MCWTSVCISCKHLDEIHSKTLYGWQWKVPSHSKQLSTADTYQTRFSRSVPNFVNIAQMVNFDCVLFVGVWSSCWTPRRTDSITSSLQSELSATLNSQNHLNSRVELSCLYLVLSLFTERPSRLWPSPPMANTWSQERWVFFTVNLSKRTLYRVRIPVEWIYLANWIGIQSKQVSLRT